MTCIQFYNMNKLMKADYNENIKTIRVISHKIII